MVAWIRMVSDKDADADQRKALDFARTPHGTVDNVMRAHSLRPNTMIGHATLYRAVLHDDSNRIPKWLQETIGSYVSMLNGCEYSLANHWKNARDLIADEEKSGRIFAALSTRQPEAALSGSELAFLVYAEKLTLNPAEMVEADVQVLKDTGVDDGCVLEANQIVGYFNYANRLLNGLGVTTEGDIVGYYAKDAEATG